MDLGLKGKIAVITGGSDGIGRATAILLAREGAKVVICARGQEKLDETVKKYGGVDLLLNNAGLSQRGKFLEIDDKMWDIDIDIKVYGAIRCLRLLANAAYIATKVSV